MKQSLISKIQVIEVAVDLVSDGENPEYDRALCEMVYDLTGDRVTPDGLRITKKYGQYLRDSMEGR